MNGISSLFRSGLSVLLFVSCTQAGGVAQSTGVAGSTSGVQIGVLGLWVHYEAGLSNALALRTELGLDSGLFYDLYAGPEFILTPGMSLEPRWYYNLQARARKERRTDGNSGNYISLLTRFNPDWFVITNSSRNNVPNQLAFIPMWGIRRHIGRHFTYETAVGLGYRVYPGDAESNEADVHLHLRFGYRFDRVPKN